MSVECGGCTHKFSTERNFDRHRTGKFDLPDGHPEGRRCRTPAEMEAIGLVQNAQGVWREAPPTGGIPAAAVDQGRTDGPTDEGRPTESGGEVNRHGSTA